MANFSELIDKLLESRAASKVADAASEEASPTSKALATIPDASNIDPGSKALATIDQPSLDPSSNAIVPTDITNISKYGAMVPSADAPSPIRDVTPIDPSKLPVPYADQSAAVAGLSDEEAAKNPILAALKKYAAPAAAIGAVGGTAALLGSSGDGDAKAADSSTIPVPPKEPVVSDEDYSDDDDAIPVKKKVVTPVKTEDAPLQHEDVDSGDKVVPAEEDPSDADIEKDMEGQLDKAPINPSEATKADLIKAQHQRDATRRDMMLGKALLQMGTGIAVPYGKANTEVFDSQIANADQPIKDLNERIAMEKQDSGSQYSTDLRQFMADKFGTQLPDSLSAAQIENSIAKPAAALFEQQEKSKQAAELKQATLAQAATLAREKMASQEQQTNDKLEQRRDQANMMAELKKQQSDSKASDSQTKTYQKTAQQMEQLRGSPAVIQAEKDMYAADKADSLANMYGDPSKLSPAQVHLLASEVGKIAAGGVSSQAELAGITPDTFRGKLASVTEKFTNSPSAANAQDFIKQYTDYTHALRKDAQKTVTDRYGRILNANKSRMAPEDVDALKETYLNRFGAPEATPTATPAKGAAPAVSQSPKVQPKNVIQNGVTYTLNPATGQYE